MCVQSKPWAGQVALPPGSTPPALEKEAAPPSAADPGRLPGICLLAAAPRLLAVMLGIRGKYLFPPVDGMDGK